MVTTYFKGKPLWCGGERKKRDLASSQELEYVNYTEIGESNQEKSPCLEERDEQDRGFGTVYIPYTVRPPNLRSEQQRDIIK